MTTYNVLVALHVLGVVWWIGGVALVTCVLLPSLQRLPADDRLTGIRRFEHRFAPQARIAVVLVGITGAWMLSVTSWTRAGFSHGWWLDLMLLVWVLFAVMLFIVEPLGLPAKVGLIHKRKAFLALHAVLLSLALAAIFCGVIGARGGFA